MKLCLLAILNGPTLTAEPYDLATIASLSDNNGNGRLGVEELGTAFKRYMGLDKTEEELDEIILQKKPGIYIEVEGELKIP